MGNFYLYSTDPYGAHTRQNDTRQENSTDELHKGMFLYIYMLLSRKRNHRIYYTSQVKIVAET